MNSLAVATLRHIDSHPNLLSCRPSVLLETLGPSDSLSGRIGHGSYAGSPRFSVHVDRTCAAKSNAASKFRPGQFQNAAQAPEQQHFRFIAERLLNSVHLKLNHFPA